MGSSGPDFTAESSSGVVIARRLRGFPAYRALRDGDIVTGLVDTGDKFATEPKTDRKSQDAADERVSLAEPMQERFKRSIRTFNAGKTLTLEILRNGQHMTVQVSLSPLPAVALQQSAVDDWLEERDTQADKYWDSNFRSIVRDDLAPISIAH